MVTSQWACGPDTGSSGGTTYSSGSNRGAAISAGLGAAGAILGALGSMAERDRENARRRRDAEEEEERADNARRQAEYARRQEACNEGDRYDRSARQNWSEREYTSASFDFDSAAYAYDRCNRGDVAQTARNNSAKALKAQRELEARQERDRQCDATFESARAHFERAQAAVKTHDYVGALAELRSARSDYGFCGSAKTLAGNAEQIAQVEGWIAREKAEAERVRRAEEQRRQEEARLASCERAKGDFIAGERNMYSLDAAGAITRYTRAINDFGLCGDTRNVGAARQNLELAQKLAAALKEEAGRVAAAQTNFGGANPYKGDNPFAVGEQDRVPDSERAKPRLPLGNLYGEATKLCEGKAEKDTDAWKQCIRYAQAAVISKFEPDVAGHCRAFGEAEDRVDCLTNRYANLVQGRVRIVKASTENYEYNDLVGRPKPPRGGSLREALRNRLNESSGTANGTAAGDKPDPDGKPTAVNSGSAVAPGPTDKNPTAAEARSKTRAEREQDILGGLPDYTERGSLSAPSSGISAPDKKSK
ncbi:hypothetical protein [Methylobacterium brachythecii]|uniref:Uncharacterized protein n=1 Tax=Methylobacterium brachythecii TaxID=1176177 RepID=A0A7W6F9N3_9HYPH|nr:hypothetical protein [Methylobacterium brachythecii]MBB3905707.1 hypothetical protein [Methylobacterium brachythecii]GLS47047.1 hypothetical protein GCM10007884_50480 [Methylobacterium brachythecii]